MGFIPIFLFLLDHSDVYISKDAGWCLSRITKSSSENIQKVIDAAVIPKLISLINDSNSLLEAKIVSLIALGNIGYHGTLDQMNYLITCGFLPALEKTSYVNGCEDAMNDAILLLLRGTGAVNPQLHIQIKKEFLEKGIIEQLLRRSHILNNIYIVNKFYTIEELDAFGKELGNLAQETVPKIMRYNYVYEIYDY